MMENDVYFIVIALLVAESYKILIYENKKTNKEKKNNTLMNFVHWFQRYRILRVGICPFFSLKF